VEGTRRATTDAPTRTLRVIGTAMAVTGADEMSEVPGGNPQRLLGVVAANGGSATLDQITDSIWPDEDSEASRARLRNVLLRLRRGVGNVVTRTASGVRLAPDVTCDLLEFQRLAADALAAVRTDPDLAGQVATDAVQLADGPVFVDFEYEEWAAVTRRNVDQQLLGLLDLLSVQAEDNGDLALAQSYAERALRLDRYSDSRYVRLAELHSMQGRRAAAVALLNDADRMAQEVGAAVPAGVHRRRDDLLRRQSASR
jgi:DNA-binding SARP family transcriptional activator